MRAIISNNYLPEFGMLITWRWLLCLHVFVLLNSTNNIINLNLIVLMGWYLNVIHFKFDVIIVRHLNWSNCGRLFTKCLYILYSIIELNKMIQYIERKTREEIAKNFHHKLFKNVTWEFYRIPQRIISLFERTKIN